VTTATATQIITLRTRRIGTMNAIYLGPDVLVESECKPGTWYVVNGSTCSCPSGVYRGKCKHTAVAATAAEIDRNEAKPVPAVMYPSTCPDTKEAWLPEPKPLTTDYHCAECGRVQPMPRMAGVPFGWVDRDPQHVSAGLVCDRCVMANALMEYDPGQRTGYALNH
jgi:hypothetical protein